MGGREKSWKFQSPEQIKELVIKTKTEDAQKRVYAIAYGMVFNADDALDIGQEAFIRTGDERGQRRAWRAWGGEFVGWVREWIAWRKWLWKSRRGG
jgi:DNA-directed RNA polymerase specialized sigma24 family protein